MNKIEYTLILNEYSYKFNVKSDSSEIKDSKIFRYAKMSMSKKGLLFNDLVSDVFKSSITQCTFCDLNSSFNVEYLVDRNTKEVRIKGISLIKVGDNYINYHCKSGKNSGCPGSKLNPNSIEYVSNALKINKEEANFYILERNKSPFYSKNFNSEEEYKKSQSRNRAYYINKYGIEEGEKRYESFCNVMKIKNNSEYLIKKFGFDGYKEICSKKAVCSLDYFIRKFGKDGEKKWNDHIKKISITKESFIKKHGDAKWKDHLENIQKKKSLDFLIDVYGNEMGIIKFRELRKSYSFSKEDYINKYGLDKWLNRISKPSKKYSKEANVFFDLVVKKLKELNFTVDLIKYGEFEFYLWDDEYRRVYFYDFFASINGKNIIIEYDQIFWHPINDEKILYFGDVFLTHMTRNEKKCYDERKEMYARYKGYPVISCKSDLKNPTRDQWKFKNLVEETINDIKKICGN